MLLTIIFAVLFFSVFGKLLGVAVKACWGLFKVFFTLVFLPVILIAFVIKGLMALALPILVVIGIITVIKYVFARA